MENDDSLDCNLSHGIRLELAGYLGDVQNQEEDEMKEIIPVVDIPEVVQLLFLDLDNFKGNEEDLSEETHKIENVHQEDAVYGER